jgi:serine/threonine-protein kinase HipA
MSRKGLVYFQDMLASLLVETDEGYEFSYQADYLENKNAKPVSLTLPLSVQKYESKVLFSFFDGLKPEGCLLDMATTHWKLKRND